MLTSLLSVAKSYRSAIMIYVIFLVFCLGILCRRWNDRTDIEYKFLDPFLCHSMMKFPISEKFPTGVGQCVAFLIARILAVNRNLTKSSTLTTILFSRPWEPLVCINSCSSPFSPSPWARTPAITTSVWELM